MSSLWSSVTIQVLSAAIFGAFPSIVPPCLRIVPYLTPVADLLDAADGVVLRLFIAALGFLIGYGIAQLLGYAQFLIMRALLGDLRWIHSPRSRRTKVKYI